MTSVVLVILMRVLEKAARRRASFVRPRDWTKGWRDGMGREGVKTSIRCEGADGL